jgi:hypothetical protein
VVSRTVARVPVEEHMANYRATRAGNSELIEMRSSVSQSSRKHLRESDERPRSHISPFFRSVIHPGI